MPHGLDESGRHVTHVVCKPRIGYFVVVLESGSVFSRIVQWDCMFPAQPRGNP